MIIRSSFGHVFSSTLALLSLSHFAISTRRRRLLNYGTVLRGAFNDSPLEKLASRVTNKTKKSNLIFLQLLGNLRAPRILSAALRI